MKCEYIIDPLKYSTDWTVLGNDTTNLGASTVTLFGAGALEFDKADGAANTVFAGAYRTIDRPISDQWFSPFDYLCTTVYCSAITNVAYAFARIGASAAANIEWRWADSLITAGQWTTVKTLLGNCFPTGVGMTTTTVNGYDVWDMDYLAVGVAFDAEGNTLADIRMQRLWIEKSEVCL